MGPTIWLPGTPQWGCTGQQMLECLCWQVTQPMHVHLVGNLGGNKSPGTRPSTYGTTASGHTNRIHLNLSDTGASTVSGGWRLSAEALLCTASLWRDGVIGGKGSLLAHLAGGYFCLTSGMTYDPFPICHVSSMDYDGEQGPRVRIQHPMEHARYFPNVFLKVCLNETSSKFTL